MKLVSWITSGPAASSMEAYEEDGAHVMHSTTWSWPWNSALHSPVAILKTRIVCMKRNELSLHKSKLGDTTAKGEKIISATHLIVRAAGLKQNKNAVISKADIPKCHRTHTLVAQPIELPFCRQTHSKKLFSVYFVDYLRMAQSINQSINQSKNNMRRISLTTSLASGVTETFLTQSEWPVMVRTQCPVETSHSLMVLSRDDESK